MRNLKVVRRLSGETRKSLRTKLRHKDQMLCAKSGQIMVLEHQLQVARKSPSQRLPVPKGFADHLLANMCGYLARGLAEKVTDDMPELARAAHASARYMEKALRDGMSLHGGGEGMAYTVEETLQDHNAHFKLHIDGVSINRVESISHMRCVRDMSSPYDDDPVVKMPRQVHVTNRDLQNY